MGWNYMKAHSFTCLGSWLGGLKGYMWVSTLCRLTCSVQGNLRGAELLTRRLKASSASLSMNKVALPFLAGLRSCASSDCHILLVKRES